MTTPVPSVLVTGGSGLVGSAVVEELGQRGLATVVFDPHPPPTPTRHIVHVAGDVRDLGALEGAIWHHHVDRVIHLAAMIGVLTEGQPHEASAVNVVGTSNVFEAARRAELGRVVWSSSIMRQAGCGLPQSGGDHPAPRNLYGAHKLAAEFEAGIYRRRFGVDVVTVAIAATLGLGRRGVSPERAPHLHLMGQVAKGEPAIVPADPEWAVPLRPAADVARILVAAALASRAEPFYQAGGRYTSLGELADAARRVVPGADISFTGGAWPTLPLVSDDASTAFAVPLREPEEMVAEVLGVADRSALDERAATQHNNPDNRSMDCQGGASMANQRVRIGCGSAYAEDRIEPAIELIEHGELDYLSLDCLAERTLVQAQLRRLEDPELGYDLRLERLVRSLVAPAVDRGVTFIANMGAANPTSGARRTKELLGELGHGDAKVASITGDDVLDIVRERNLMTSSGRRVGDLEGEVVTANAYVGAEPIVQALEMGADVVVGGRLADPSLFLAPAIHEYGWGFDDWDLLAGGQTAGHLLECGTHGIGANFADPPYREVPELWNLGLPIADVYPDGSSTIWKLPGTGGLVDVENCKAQLVYEIHDPANYLTPDLAVDVTDVTLEQRSADHVFVQGARGRPRPETLKVLVGVREGFIGEGEISFAGPGALGRAQLAAETVTKRLAHDGVSTNELRVDYIGYNSVHGAATPADAPEPWEVRLRVAGRCDDPDGAAAVAQEVEFMYFGPAAGGGARKQVRPVLAMYSVLLPRADVDLTVEMLEG